jgi:hypothetical protein
VNYQPPVPAPDTAAAEWIGPRLAETFGAVCRTVPTGFEAYARVLHPADPGARVQRRWAEVANSNNRTMHSLAQYDRIARAAPDSRHLTPLLDVQTPERGNLVPDALRALCESLQAHTPDTARCWFAVWEGWGELGDVRRMVASASTDAGPGPVPQGAPAAWQLDLRAPRFMLPGRAYYLFTGPLQDVLRIGWWVTADWFVPRSPNLFWPDDRRWCVATEVDFDSTLVAGPTGLIDEVLRRPELEAWPVSPMDSLGWDGDTVNQL